MMKELLGNSHLFGGNAPFVEELYEAYLDNPQSVPEEWREYFDRMQVLPGGEGRDVAHAPIVEAFAQRAKQGRLRAPAAPAELGVERKQVYVQMLINAYRFLGNRWAELDPLKRVPRPPIAELEPTYYDLSEADLETVFNTGTLVGPERATLREILQHLRETYCGTIGAEYMYISDPGQKRWIQQRLESVRGRPQLAPEMRRRLLERVTAAETLEKYLHTRYVGQKRFSLEGGETIIAMMDELVQRAGAHGVEELVIGMAHRGRLNVLVNTLGKSPKDLFAEFEGKAESPGSTSLGDVKYHLGFSSDVSTPGGPVHLTLAFNPSHLEIVNPVVEGSVRARQHRRKDRAGEKVISVLLHGDAAFAGQGVVMETLNLSQTRGYSTGGTVHLIVNNQIGFTTSDPRDARSSIYCTDVAKMIEVPIFHVNGDDPEAALFVTQLAMDYRKEFKKDVVIDLVCFRRLGHNEQDEPFVTQPLMYKKIAQHPGTRKLYADKLVAQGVVPPEEPERLIRDYRQALDEGRQTSSPVLSNFQRKYAVDWGPFLGAKWTDAADTSLPLKEIEQLGARLTTIPEGFKLHPSVERVVAGAPRDGARQADARLGHGGEPGLRLAAGERVRRAALRAGLGPRHVRAPPRGVPRPEPREVGRRLVHPAFEPPGRPGRLRRHRLGALRGGGARLRVRLLLRRAERAGDLGGAVRGLRQRRAGRDRPVHHLGRGEVGPDVRTHAVPAARLRGAGPRAFLGPPRALPAALRRAQRPGVRADHAGADLPPASAGRWCGRSASRSSSSRRSRCCASARRSRA